jgi:hypothetical protein
MARTRKPAQRVVTIREQVAPASASSAGRAILLVAIGRDGSTLGEMDLLVRKSSYGRFTQVIFARSRTPGAGVGTKLYERAARVACRENAPLMSDRYRTQYAEGFWTKQARKGRATCVVAKGGKRLNSDFAISGGWSCGRYALTCPAPRSLRGIT